MTSWTQGRSKVEELIAAGEIETGAVDVQAAHRLIAQSRTHLESAGLLADSDVELAYDALHAANRKALTAVLSVQGLRATRAGGHTAVYQAVRAQLHPPAGPRLAPYDRIRRTRNQGDYLGQLTANAEDVREDRALSTVIVDTCEQVLSFLPAFWA